MKKIIFFLATISILLGHTEEKTYFIYGNTHAMGGYPMIGLGVRAQKGIHALDVSGNACPINPPTSFNIFHLRTLYLIYPKQMGLYFGGGLGFLNEPETIKISQSFESAIGYQWKNRLFFEVNATLPFKTQQTLAPVWPGLTLGCGF